MTAYEQVTATPGQSAGTTETARTEASAVAGTAKDEATAVTRTAAEAASEVAGSARQQAATVATEAKEQLGDLTSQAREQVAAQAATQKDKAATQVQSFAEQLRSMARGEPTDGPAVDLVRELSTKVQQLADRLQNAEPGELLDEVRRYARKKPGTFLLGAAVAGFVSGRLVKGATSGDTESSQRYAGRDSSAYSSYGSAAEVGRSDYGELRAPADSYGSETYAGETYPTEPIQTYPSEPQRAPDTGGTI